MNRNLTRLAFIFLAAVVATPPALAAPGGGPAITSVQAATGPAGLMAIVTWPSS